MSEHSAPVEDTPQVTNLAKGRRHAALGFIFATSLMDIISMGLMIPVLPNLVKEMAGGDTATATHVTGLFAVAWGLMQFFCSPIQGMLSDRFGRRPVLLISIFGLSVDYIFMALSPTLGWLFLGRLINGMTAASFSTAGAYIADITPPEQRARNFGLMGAAFSVGFIIGPALGGVLGDADSMRSLGYALGGPALGQTLAEHHLRIPLYFSAGLGAINWLYGLLILPESLPPERRQPKFNWKRANPIGSFVLLKSHRELLGLAGVYFLFQMAHNVFPSIFVLFVGERYHWGPREAGLMLMATGVSTAIVQGGVVGPVVKKLGERKAAITGLVAGVLGMLIYAIAPTGWIFLLGVPVFAFSALIGPGLQGLMTRRVSPQEQGQLQGANSGMMGVAAIVCPPMFTGLFALAIHHRDLPMGLPIFAAGAFMLLGLLLALQVAKPTQTEPATAA